MERNHLIATIGFLTWLVACGSRSGVFDGLSGAGAGGGAAGQAGAAGAGGFKNKGGAGGNGGSGSSGGTGGGSVCSVDFGPSLLSAAPYHHQRSPIISPLRSDESEVAVAVSESLVEPPWPVAAHMRLFAMKPWNDTPWGVLAGVESSFLSGAGQTAMTVGLQEGTLSFAYPLTPSPPASVPQGLQLMPHVTPTSGAAGVAINLSDPSDSQLALTLLDLAAGLRVGYQVTTDGRRSFDRALYHPGTNDLSIHRHIGCGSMDLVADSADADGEIWDVWSTSKQFFDCMQAIGYDDLPGQVYLGHEKAWTASDAAAIASNKNDAVALVKLVPRTVGVWVVWQFQGLNAEAPPPVMATKLDLDPTETHDDFEVAPAPRPGSLAVARLGEGMVLAWIQADATPSEERILVRRIDENGAPIGTDVSIHPPVLGVPLGSLAVRASPKGDRILVAWDQRSGKEPSRVYVARIGCGDKPF